MKWLSWGTEEACGSAYFSGRLWEQSQSFLPTHMPGSHADVKIANWKLPHAASCPAMPFKGFIFYTLQFTTSIKATFTACSLKGQQSTRLSVEKTNHQLHGTQDKYQLLTWCSFKRMSLQTHKWVLTGFAGALPGSGLVSMKYFLRRCLLDSGLSIRM